MSDQRPPSTGLSWPDQGNRPDVEFIFPGRGIFPAEEPDPTYDLTCQRCGKDFQSVSHHARWCGPSCRTLDWQDRNYAKITGYRRNRKLREENGSLKQKEWLEILALTGKCCFYCGGIFEHMDHVIPLSKGGTHDITNVVPACRKCNLSKSAKFIHEWKSPAAAFSVYTRLNQLHARLRLVWGESEEV